MFDFFCGGNVFVVTAGVAKKNQSFWNDVNFGMDEPEMTVRGRCGNEEEKNSDCEGAHKYRDRGGFVETIISPDMQRSLRC